MSAGLTVVRARDLLDITKQTFFDDWSSGDNTKWPTIGGAPPVSATFGRTGNGVQIKPAASAKNLGSSTGKFAQTHPWGSFSLWFNFATLPLAAHTAQILTVANTNNVQNFDCYIEATSQKLWFDLVNADALNTGVSITSAVWHNLQGRILFGATTTTAHCLLDGVDIGSMQSTGQTPSSMRSCIIGDTTTADTFEMWVDDFRLTVADIDPGWISS